MVSEVQLYPGLPHFIKSKPLSVGSKLLTSLGVAEEKGNVWLLITIPQNTLVKLLLLP